MRVRSYQVVLPPPWVRLPVREDSAAHVERLVEDVAQHTPKEIPPDQVGPKKRELSRTLAAHVARLESQGGLDLYFPADLVHGFLVQASFSVSEVRPPGASGQDVEDVRAVLLRESGTSVVTTPGDDAIELPATDWVRRERVLPGEQDRDPARIVDYTGPVPGDASTWLLVSFSCVGTDAEDPEGTAVMLVALFDAIMTTWRWVVSDG